MSSHLLGRRPWLLSGLTSLSALLISSEAPSPSSSSFSSSSSSFLSPLIEVSRVQDEEEEKKKSNGEGENKKKKSPLFSLSSRERRSLDTFADISHPQRENQTPLFLLQSRANDEGSLRSFRSSTSFCPTPSSSWILSFFPSFLSPSSFIFSPLLSPSSSCSSLSSLERHLPPIERASSSSLSSPSGVRSDRSLASQGENKEGGEEGERGEEEKQPDILRRYRRVGTFTSPVGKWSMSFNVFPSTSTRYVYVHQSSHSMALCDGINGAHAAAFVAQHFLHSSSRSSSSCSFSSCCSSSSSPCSSSSCCTSTSKRVSPNSPSSASTSPLSSSPSPPSTLSFSSSPSSTSPSTTPDESLCEEEKEGERCLARDRKCSLGKEREEDSFCCRSLSPQSQEKRCVGGKSPGESSEHEEKKKKNGCDISPGMALQTDRREPRETNHEMCAADEETHSEEKKEKIGEKEKENKKKKTSGEMLSKGEGADRRSHKDDKKKGEGEEEKREEEETEMDFGFFVARKAGRKYQRKLKEKEKEEKKEKKDDEEEEAKEEGVKKKKKLREEEEEEKGGEESFSEVLLKNLQEMKHSHMVKECNLHFRNLEQEYLNACNGDPRLLAEGCSIGAAFSTPSGLLICTLGDVGAVLAVREGQHALDRLNARENKSSSSSSISTIDKNASSGSPSSSSSLLKRKNFSAGSKGGAEEEEEKERRIPLVAWRLSDLHNTENANEMRRIRRSHPNESTQDLLDSRQLLKGVTHATRGLGAFHLKAPEINNLLPEEKRVKNFLPAQSSRQPSPYLSSELVRRERKF